eukprot:1098366-Pelagomonas_calceolata.AAC.5
MTSISPGHRDIQGVFFYLNKFHAVPSPMAQLRLTIEIGMSKISCLDGLGVAPSAQTLMHPINYFAVLTQNSSFSRQHPILEELPLYVYFSIVQGGSLAYADELHKLKKRGWSRQDSMEKFSVIDSYHRVHRSAVATLFFFSSFLSICSRGVKICRGGDKDALYWWESMGGSFLFFAHIVQCYVETLSFPGKKVACNLELLGTHGWRKMNDSDNNFDTIGH